MNFTYWVMRTEKDYRSDYHKQFWKKFTWAMVLIALGLTIGMSLYYYWKRTGNLDFLKKLIKCEYCRKKKEPLPEEEGGEKKEGESDEDEGEDGPRTVHP